MKRNHFFRFAAFLQAAILCCLIAGAVSFANTAKEREPEFSEFEELNGKTISMLTGDPFDAKIDETSELILKSKAVRRQGDGGVSPSDQGNTAVFEIKQ